MRRAQGHVLTGIVLLLLTLAIFPLAASAEPPQDAANGQKVWDTKLCKNCHGPQGEGDRGRLGQARVGAQDEHPP